MSQARPEPLAAEKATPEPTNTPVVYGGVTYFDQKSADAAREHFERALAIEKQWTPAMELAGYWS